MRACCRNDRALGRIGDSSLGDIWRSHARASLQSALQRHDYSLGCASCGEEVAAEGSANSYPRIFDRFGVLSEHRWPVRMEFNLSNRCNLQCVQCDGDLSSAIRSHREHRPPLADPYGESFFEELRAFIPHLRWASFAGGEPFLAPANARVWSLLKELNPEVPGTIVTNGTRWGAKQQAAVEGLRLGFTISVDAAQAPLFEAIRVGARLSEVRDNAEAMLEDARNRGADGFINFCLMRSNALELPNVLTWAEANQARVNVSVVRSPRSMSLVDAPQDELRRTASALEGCADANGDGLVLNAGVLNAEVQRIRSWAVQEPTEVLLRGVGRFKVLGFSCSGSTQTGVQLPQRVLDDEFPGSPVTRIVVDREDLIHRVDGDPAPLLGCTTAELLGRPVVELGDLAHDRRTEDERVDRQRIVATFPGGHAVAIMAPDRDENGWAETASIWLVQPSGPADGHQPTGSTIRRDRQR